MTPETRTILQAWPKRLDDAFAMLRRASQLLLMVMVLLVAGCGGVMQTGGEIVDVDVEDNRTLLSPPIVVPPLLGCGNAVTVMGFVPNAKIEIFADGVAIGGDIGIDPERETFPVAPELVAGQVVTAIQTFDGVISGPSIPVEVEDHTKVYPDGLPRPNFPFLYLYQCGVATYVDQLPPGGTVRVFAREPVPGASETVVGEVKGVDAGQTIGIGPPFETGHEITAESQICTDISPRSEMHIVQPAPAMLPAPAVHDLYDGGRIVVLSQLVNGSLVTIQNGGTTIGGGGAPAGHTRFHVDPPVADGDTIEAVQALCDVESVPGTTTVKPCSDLPPPQLRAPSAGDTEVHLINVVPGARVQVFAGGVEIGDGGGSTVQLTRPLMDGETLIVVQSINGCVSSKGYRVDVGTGLEDPADAGLCPEFERFEYGTPGDPNLQTTDVSSYFNSPSASVSTPMNAVPLHGVVRYPVGYGPYPLILVVHGNHSPLEASYPGYDYLLNLFASHCMIAVSVEEDFLNGRVNGEMDARAIVLLRHLQLWREWNRTPGHQFFTKVDMGRIGLAGHSRGGEAVVAAKHFNSALHNPADPDHNFNFAIRGLYAIAPVDGQFEGPNLVLSNADYYVMHGTHDGDVASFDGHRMYDRAFPVALPTTHFKGLLWVHGANHAQWNEIWSSSGDPSVIVDLGPGGVGLMSAGTQQLIGKIYMTAFFLSSVKGWSEYNAFMAGDATFSSLPAANTWVFQYQDPARVFINHYEEDDDPDTGSFPGVSNMPLGSLTHYEDYAFSDNGAPHFLWGETDGLIAGWKDAQDGEVVIKVSDALRDEISNYSYLALRLGQTHEASPDQNTPGFDKDMVVQFSFDTVDGPEVKVSDYVRLPYPLVTTAAPWGGGPKTIKQTVRIPFVDLVGELGAEVELNRLTEIRLKFNQHNAGILAIDEIQFTE